MALLTDLPTEILQLIFEHLTPTSLGAVLQTCKPIHDVANTPIVWRHLCITRFQSWASYHNIATKFTGPISKVEWRSLFVQRLQTEKHTKKLLDQLLSTQQGRIARIQAIAEFEDDAKEVLLTEKYTPDDAKDVLARRFYANACLERINREKAIRIWRDVAEGNDVPLEKALGAYDVFARTDPDIELDSLSDSLDLLAKQVLEEHVTFISLSTRKKASVLTSFLQNHGFNGVGDASYRDVRNSFIGLAVSSPGHESLPLISVAIFCSLARRLSMDARPCGFPYHVYCLVYAPPSTSLDGDYAPNQRDLAYMYLDPFRSTEPVAPEILRSQLRQMRLPTNRYESFLSDAPTAEMVLRTARNIMNSVQTIRQNDVGRFNINASWTDTYPDTDSAFYAALWAALILHDRDNAGNEDGFTQVARLQEYLPYLLEHFQTHFPWDINLLEKYILPLFSRVPDGDRLEAFVHSMHNRDAMPKHVKRREQGTDNVRYKVGQLFSHKRYLYEGIIIGWDTSCDAGETWIQHMGVDRLTRGRNQSFYHVLVSDKSIRYVAEENIAPVGPDSPTTDYPSKAMLLLAGRYFKRWDPERYHFVSNLQDEYPDD
jgi:F-box protein 21